LKLRKSTLHSIGGIEFTTVYSRRKTIGISVRPDSTVILRAPYLTSFSTIERIINQKSEWIIKHRNNYREKINSLPKRVYADGEIHLFRGRSLILRIHYSKKQFVNFTDENIELGLSKINDEAAVRRLLYKGYKNEAEILFREFLSVAIDKYARWDLKPSGLIIRSMKRRWGSCSNKGVITLNSELVKLTDGYTEYVIAHELCHLRHHNHGEKFYKLLSEIYPEWKLARKELRQHVL
jgi:predicted metal-dependent hydrolase